MFDNWIYEKKEEKKRMVAIEFYWNDLTEQKQKEVLETLKIGPNDHNWDLFPIATLNIEVKDDLGE